MIIRPATIDDVPAIHQLIVELAVYEKEPEAVETTAEQLEMDGFGSHPVFDALVAEVEGRVKGFALYYEGYSTWKGRTLYLEDFVVTESMRGKGLGKALFEAVVDVAKSRGVARMDWQVLDWNTPAIDFYKRYGAHIENRVAQRTVLSAGFGRIVMLTLRYDLVQRYH